MPSGTASALEPAPVPKLRADLILSAGEGDQRGVTVIKDPTVGRFFRFGETETFILQQFDGATPLALVRRRTEERFECELQADMLLSFTDRIRRLGLLEGAAPSRSGEARSGRVRGDLFYLRFKAFDPDEFLDRLVVRLRFCFTPAFVAFSLGLMCLAAGLMMVHWPQIRMQFGGLLRLESVVVAWLVVLSVIALHELAHAVTCKHFGGRVHEMGMMLIFFQPAFYCNVSDAWLFPRKSQRLWVTFAGAYFELFVWALAMVVWRLTEPDSTVNRFALIVVATSAIKTLFNMNPLIKLDGYYLLSDWLGIPNLRSKASECLRAGIRVILQRRPGWPPGLTARERRICLVYGALATIFTAGLLSSLALHVGARLTAHFQAWGFILFTLLIAGVFRKSLFKTLGSSRTESRSAQPPISRWRKPLRGALLLVLAAALLYWVRLELRISGEFTILPAHNAEVRARVEGIIDDILVDEGDVVNAGQVVARLSERDYRAELSQTLAAIEEKTAQLRLLEAGPRAEEIAVARTVLAKTEERLKFELRRLEMDRELFDEKLLSRREYELTEELTAVRKKELDEANEQLRMLLAGNRPEEIEAVAAEVRRLEVQRQHLEEKLTLLKVTSPVSGVVITHKPRELVGQRAAKGDLILKVHELNTVRAEIAISEKDIGLVETGRPVLLKCRAYPGQTFRGTVASIAPVATRSDDWQTERTVLVTTRIANESLLLKPEMTGNAKISAGERGLFEILTRRAARYLRVEFWSWW